MQQLATKKSLNNASASMEEFFYGLLIQPLVTADRHTLQLLGSYFYKGLMQTKAGRISLANYYFETGERYLEGLPRDTYLWLVLQDEYLPKKAYYLHKTGEMAAAEAMVNATMEVMKALEQQGFEHLLFGRVQQYHNLARMYFSYGQTGDAIAIAGELTAFLLSGHSAKLADLNIPLHKHPEKYALLNYLFICQVCFETLGVVLKFSNRDNFLSNSHQFLRPVVNAVDNYQPKDEDEQALKEYISSFKSFYAQEYTQFYDRVTLFIDGHPGFFPDSRKTMESYAGYFRI